MIQSQVGSRSAWTPPRMLSYVLLTMLALATLVPFLWMVDTALKPQIASHEIVSSS